MALDLPKYLSRLDVHAIEIGIMPNQHISRITVAGLVLVMLGILPERAEAQVRRGSGTISLNITWPARGSGGSRATSASQTRSSEINGIRTELTKMSATKRRAFETSPEMTAAKEAVVQKWAHYRSASDAALQPLRGSDEYRRLLGTIDRLQNDLDAARDDAAGLHKVSILSSDLMICRSNLRKLEAEHLAEDESVTAARYDAVDATGQIVALRRDFEQWLRTDAEFRAARDRLDAVRDRMLAEAR